MAEENVRCVNPEKNDWGLFPKSIAYDKSWQSNSGFYPEPLPAIEASTAQTIANPQATPAKRGRRAKNQLTNT